METDDRVTKAHFVDAEKRVVQFTTKISDGRGKEAPGVEATFKVDFSDVSHEKAILRACAASSVPVTIRGTAKRAFKTFDEVIAWAEAHATYEEPYELKASQIGSVEYYEDPSARAAAAAEAGEEYLKSLSKEEIRKRYEALLKS